MRVFVHPNIRASKAIAAFDAKLTSREVRPEGRPNLDSIKPGMVIRPGKDGRPDMSTAYEIETVTASVIKLKSGGKGLPAQAGEPIVDTLPDSPG